MNFRPSFDLPAVARVPRTFLLAPLAAAFLAAGIAFGQTASSEAPVTDPIQLEKFEVSEKGVSRANNILKPDEIRSTSEPGTNALLLLSRLPGVSNNSSNTFGIRTSDGSDLRLRAFGVSAIAIAVDGIPTIDTGGMGSTPANRLIDSENLQSTAVSPGTADVSTPSYSALGGSINFYTRDPARAAGGQITGTYGSWDLLRVFARADTGEIFPGLSAFVSASDVAQHVAFGPVGVQKRKKQDVRVRYEKGALSLVGSISHIDVNDHDTRPISGTNYGNWIPYQPGNATLGDLTDRGRNWFYSPVNDGNANGLASIYYDKNRNGRNDTIYSLRATFTPTPALRITATPYFQTRDGYNMGAVPYSTALQFFADANLNQYQRTGTFRTDIAPPINPGLDVPAFLTAYVNAPTAAARTALRNGINVSAAAPNARIAFTTGNRYGLPLNLNWKFSNHTVDVGGWVERDNVDSTRKGYNLVGGAIENPFNFHESFTTYFDNHSQNQASQLYVKDTVRLIENRLGISFGAKALNVKIRYQGTPDVLSFYHLGDPSNPGWLQRDLTYSDYFQPQAGATFSLTQHDELFVNYSQNFNPPSLGSVASSTFDPQTLHPERSSNVDVGWRAGRNKWSASLAGYYTSYQNRIGSVTPFDPLGFGSTSTQSQVRNLGELRGHGVEFSLAYTLTKNLRLNTAVTRQTLKFQDNYRETNGSLVAIKDKTVPNTPKWSVKTDATYSLGGYFVGVNVQVVDSVFLNTANTQRLPGYTLVGLGFGYDGFSRRDAGAFRNLRIAVNVENLFDRYWYYTAGGYAYTNGSFSVGLPRATYLSVSTKF